MIDKAYKNSNGSASKIILNASGGVIMAARSVTPTTAMRQRLMSVSFERMPSQASPPKITGNSKLSPKANKSLMTSDKYSLIFVSSCKGMLPIMVSKLKKNVNQDFDAVKDRYTSRGQGAFNLDSDKLEILDGHYEIPNNIISL